MTNLIQFSVIAVLLLTSINSLAARHRETPFERLENGLVYREFPSDLQNEQGLSLSKGTVIITHGFLEYSGRYDRITTFFNGLGFDVITYDLRGHGESEGRRAYVKNFDVFVSDLENIVKHVIENDLEEKPVLLYGHSMGGLITFRFGVNSPLASKIDRYILSSPALNVYPLKGLDAFFEPLIRSLGTKGPIGKFRRSSGITSQEITNDPFERNKFEDDDSGHMQTKTTLHLALELIDSAGESNELVTEWSHPLLILQGSQDTIVDPYQNQKTFDLLIDSENSQSNTEFHLFKNSRHELNSELPETRVKVFRVIQNWLSDL